MTTYNDLYQEVILEHQKKPRNFKVLENANVYALGKNPLCGDQYAVYVKVADDGTIEDIGFQGDGCALSKASASMMTGAVKGKTKNEALAMKDEFQQLSRGDIAADQAGHLGRIGKVFEGVKEFPVRVKCATLAWHTLAAALQGETETTTE